MHKFEPFCHKTLYDSVDGVDMLINVANRNVASNNKS